MDFALATLHKTGPASYDVSHGDDSQLWVRFFTEAIHQEAASAAAGRPVFKDVPHVHILFPGDKTREIKRPVRFAPEESAPHAPDPERFAKQWAAFKAGEEEAHDGTPLEHWAPLSKSQVAELRASRIHTVEHLAAVSDSNLPTLGLGGRELRDKAKGWLAQAKDGAEVSRLVAENAGLKADIDALKAQFAELAAERQAPDAGAHKHQGGRR